MAEKLSFRILEGRIRPFIDSLVPENIERLKGHTENLKKVCINSSSDPQSVLGVERDLYHPLIPCTRVLSDYVHC